MAIKAGVARSEPSSLPNEWHTERLGSCLVSKPSYGINAAAVPFRDTLPTYIRITDIDPEGGLIQDELKSVDHLESDRFYLEENDLVFARTGASVGKSYLYNPAHGKLVYAGFLIRIKPEPTRLISKYLSAFATTGTYWQWVRVMSMRSGQPGINGTEYSQMPIPLPPLPEQRAIATALSDVDQLLTSLDQLIAKKRNIKQATMQQLLIGKQRLPGFSGADGKLKKTEIGFIPEDWQIKKLGSCLTTRPSYGINAASVAYRDTLPTYLRITDIDARGNLDLSNMTSVDNLESDRFYLEENDLVFARTGASVGKSYLYNPDHGRLVFAGFLIRIRPDRTKLNAKYLSAYVTTGAYWQWVRVMSMRSGQPGINGVEFGQLPIPLPPVSEQLAIASALSMMDSEISVLEQKREKTKLLKQGMMQELLTGRIRLV